MLGHQDLLHVVNAHTHSPSAVRVEQHRGFGDWKCLSSVARKRSRCF